LQNELAETLRVLGDTLSELDRSPQDGPEMGIERQLQSLNSLCGVSDLAALRAGLKKCAGQLADCLEALRRERAMLVTQLRDEIRTLQTHLQQAEESAAADYVTGLPNRREMERLASNSIESGRAFSLIYVWLRNFKHLERELPRTMSDRLVSLAAAEVQRKLPEGAALARWSDDELCALIDSDKPVGMKLTRDLSAQLNAHYLLSEPGANARTVTLKAQVGMVQSHSDEAPERFFYRADKLIKAIQGTA
jgi:diguanylate cyclase (GGDEF)-like protein